MQCIAIKAIALFPDESATLSVAPIHEEADTIPLCHLQTAEVIFCHLLAEFTGCTSSPGSLAQHIQEPARNRLDIYVDDTQFR
jgi:hypothetical protein